MAGTGLQNVILPKERVLHTPGISFNGLTGYSPIAAAREAIGLGKSLEEFGGGLLRKWDTPRSGYFSPREFDPETASNMGKAYAEMYAGLGKAHRIMFLTESMKLKR